MRVETDIGECVVNKKSYLVFGMIVCLLFGAWCGNWLAKVDAPTCSASADTKIEKKAVPLAEIPVEVSPITLSANGVDTIGVLVRVEGSAPFFVTQNQYWSGQSKVVPAKPEEKKAEQKVEPKAEPAKISK